MRVSDGVQGDNAAQPGESSDGNKTDGSTRRVTGQIPPASRDVGLLPSGQSLSIPGRPLVGIQYINWFDQDRRQSQLSDKCDARGWLEERDGVYFRPFQLDRTQKVESLIFKAATKTTGCYSSGDSFAAKIHASALRKLGVHFAIFDQTNGSKMTAVANDSEHSAMLAAFDGFDQDAQENGGQQRILGVPMYSVTCWGEQCHGLPKDHKYGQTEFLTLTDQVKEHLQAYSRYVEDHPDRTLYEASKPLLFLYINQGNNVYRPLSETGGALVKAFSGADGRVPTEGELNVNVTLKDGTVMNVQRRFAIKYSLALNTDIDFRNSSNEFDSIWPFECATDKCHFNRVGYTSVFGKLNGKSRSLDTIAAYSLNNAGKPYVIVRNWNEFSTTDEIRDRSFTLEPNTRLHEIDGSHDACFFYNAMRYELSVWQNYFSVDPRETPLVGDFNGDKKTDILTLTRDNPLAVGDAYVGLSTGRSFGDAQKWHDWFAINQDETVVVGDFNGDGKDDLATWLGARSREVYLAFSSGTAFEPQAQPAISQLGFDSSDILKTGDADGDGKADLILFHRKGGKVYVAKSTGVGFSPAQEWHSFFAVSTYERPEVADINGDRKADIVTFATDSPTAQGDVYVALSNGSNFGGGSSSVKWHDWFSVNPTEVIGKGDFDGDGKTDFFTFMPRPANEVYRVRSLGDGLGPNVALSVPGMTRSSSDVPLIGDADGDGKADIIIFHKREGQVRVIPATYTPECY